MPGRLLADSQCECLGCGDVALDDLYVESRWATQRLGNVDERFEDFEDLECNNGI